MRAAGIDLGLLQLGAVVPWCEKRRRDAHAKGTEGSKGAKGTNGTNGTKEEGAAKDRKGFRPARVGRGIGRGS